MAHDSESAPTFHLPSILLSTADVGRLRRELETLDEYLQAQGLREPGIPMARLPRTSRVLDEFVSLNNLNLLHATVRKEVHSYLTQLHDHAPTVQISFAVEPSAMVLQKLVLWFREHIEPTILVQVGLQPTIVAGCTIRTTNRFFDLSLRNHLQQHRQLLVDSLKTELVPVAAPQLQSTETSNV